MKPISLCFCVLSINLLFFSKGFAQSSAYVLTVDFKKKTIEFPKEDRFKRGDNLTVIVKNYNPYLYKISINNSDTSTVPPVEGQIFSWFLNPTNLTSIVSGLSSVPPIANANVTDQTAKSMMSEDFIAESNGHNLNDIANNKVNSFKETIKTKIQDLKNGGHSATAALVLNAQNDFKKYKEWVTTENITIKTLNGGIAKDLYVQSSTQDFLFDLTPDGNNFSSQTITTKISSLETLFSDKATAVEKELDIVKNKYFDFTYDVSDYYSLFKTQSQIRVGDSLLNKFFVESISLLTKMDSSLSYPELKKRKIALLQQKYLSAEYQSLPLYFLKDVKQLSIQISPWNDSLRLPSFTSNIELPRIHHFIFGVSAGFYIAKLGDQKYAVDSTIIPGVVLSDTTYKIVQDGTGSVELGVNAIAYGAWRIWDKFYIGPSLGAGVTFSSNFSPRVFIGGALIYGESSRVMLSGGYAAGNSQTISSVFNTSKSYGSLPANYTKEAIKGSWYISLNYSFLGN